MGGVQQPVLAEDRAGDLEAHGQPAAASPQGIEIAGIPASDIGTVQKSLMYIDHGSPVFSPSPNATLGLVGVTMKSTCAKAASKSCTIFVRTRCARP